MKLRAFAIVCALLALAGCSNKKDESLKPLPLVDFDATEKVQRVWSSGVGQGMDRRYATFIPAVVGNRVYVADVEGRVFAVNADNGERIWRSELELEIAGAIGAGKTIVLVGGYDGEVVALDADTGVEKWRATVSSEVAAPPQTNDDIVAVTSIDGRLFVFDAKTGKPLWSHDHVAPVLTQRSTSHPVLTSTQVIAGFDNGQVLAFSASDGAVAWEVRAAQPKGRHDLEKMVDIDGAPVLRSAYVYVTSFRGSALVVARGNGRVVWKRDASSFHSPAVAAGKMFVVTDDSRVIAFDAGNGGTVWENAEMLNRRLGAPALIGPYVASIDAKGYMHVMSTADGSFVARPKPKGDGFRAPPVAYKDGILVLSDDGVLSFYRIKDK